MCVQATAAFIAGDKALAKELGAKGRHHMEQMNVAQVAASEEAFRHRNSTKGEAERPPCFK